MSLAGAFVHVIQCVYTYREEQAMDCIHPRVEGALGRGWRCYVCRRALALSGDALSGPKFTVMSELVVIR